MESIRTLGLDRRHVLAAGMAMLLGSASTVAGAATEPSPDAIAFRAEVVALLRSIHPSVEVILDPDPEQIRIGSSVLYLGNLRGTVAGLRGDARNSAILRVVGPLAAPRATTEGPPAPFAQAASRLRLQLVPTEYRDQVPNLVHRRFSDRLLVAYALDEPDRYRMVTQPIFETWGVDQTKMEGIARRNLELASGGVEIHVSPTGRVGRFATIANEDGYVAARLLLPMVMDQVLAGLQSSALIAAVPTRDLLIAWSHHSEGRRHFGGIVSERMRKGPYGRSAELFRYAADGLRQLTAAEMFEYRP